MNGRTISAGFLAMACLLLCGGSLNAELSCSEASAEAVVTDQTPAGDDGVVCCQAWDNVCSPRWKATADALLLQRRAPALAELMVNLETPARNLNAADFDFSFHAGVDVSVARHFNNCSGVEVRYFGLDP